MGGRSSEEISVNTREQEVKFMIEGLDANDIPIRTAFPFPVG